MTLSPELSVLKISHKCLKEVALKAVMYEWIVVIVAKDRAIRM